MDKNSIKKYAVWARRELMARVSMKAEQYGISEGQTPDPDAESVNGRLLTATEKAQRRKLIERIQEDGWAQVMEEAAYTWFNRFCALRFMEVNGYLPSHVRVFTDEDNQFRPQILTEAIHLELEGLDRNRVLALKEREQTEELYKYLLMTQCNALSPVLPEMFQPLADYTELLFPDNLLREGSVIERMITMIPEEDWRDAVQIIGWLYQYYNSEKKDEVFAALKKNVKITKENIPAATQLFTPDWIVRYMVENSLGRLWLEGHPDARGQLLPTAEEQAAFAAGAREEREPKWHYYLEEAPQEPQVQAQLAALRREYAALTPEQIRVIDPCCGSGHILAYLFDVLMQIYGTYGYTTREAVASIVENNLYGLDIDPRAAQLANFAVMMKARQYDRRWFSRGIQPHVYAIVESNHVEPFAVTAFCDGDNGRQAAMDAIVRQLKDAKEYGSLLTVSPQDWPALYARFEEIETGAPLYEDAVRPLLPLVQVAEALAQPYDVVVTNPPYMGGSNMNPRLSDFIKTNYPEYKSDFFSAFVIRASHMAKQGGYCGFFTPYVWMFIQSYEKMRQYLYSQTTIETLIQFEYSAFEEATVPVCTFAFRNGHISKKGCYFRLVDFRGGMEVQRQKTLQAIADHHCGYYYETNSDNFSKIPGSPVAYWVSESVLAAYDAPAISDFVDCKSGIMAGDDSYIKLWYEPDIEQIKFDCRSHRDMGNFKWFPLNSGGEFRKWYGNNQKVIDLWHEGHNIKTNVKNYRLRDLDYYFKSGVTWGRITSSQIAFRDVPLGSLFGDAGPVGFISSGKEYILGFLCSKTVNYLLQITNPTLNYQVHDIMNLPILWSDIDEKKIFAIVQDCIAISRTDWDSFETSWDFQRHPLMRPVSTIGQAFRLWQEECDTRFRQLKANEEELNRIFIDIYGLQDELTPEVEDKDVTVRRADLGRDIRSFLSYAVGCMFGRYSLDVPGLAFAGGVWDADSYKTFPADADNIIPICDDEYFEDDLASRFFRFVETVYGPDTLAENLRFIADALGGKGNSKEVIRSYFLNDFFADHCKIYQKRPIYWQFDSGKKNGFKCLIYLHRYQPDTIARIRTDYVHEQQARYRTAIEELEKRLQKASTAERVKLNKQLKKLQEQAAELHAYEEKIHHLADQMIPLDLDDGVKVNYAKLQDVLAKIK